METFITITTILVTALILLIAVVLLGVITGAIAPDSNDMASNLVRSILQLIL